MWATLIILGALSTFCCVACAARSYRLWSDDGDAEPTLTGWAKAMWRAKEEDG